MLRTFAYKSFCALAAAALCWSCAETTVTPAAKNAFSGTIDGFAYSATSVAATRDSNNLVIITGTINNDGTFSLYFKEDGSLVHPVETAGTFINFTQRLDSLFHIDPPLADSVLADSLVNGLSDLLSSGAELLSPADCFLFYQIGRSLYYSTAGQLEVSELDETLRRISGDLDISVVNFTGGRKQLAATLEEIEYVE